MRLTVSSYIIYQKGSALVSQTLNQTHSSSALTMSPVIIDFRLRLGVISPRIVFPNRPDLDQIVPDESNILIGLIVVLNRLEKVIG